MKGMKAAAITALGVMALLFAVATGGRASSAEAKPRETAGRAKGVVVTLFHETHTHGHLAGTPNRPVNVEFTRYVGLRDELRSHLAEPANSLFLGNGDDIAPELNGVVTNGRHTIDAFNAAGIDADTFGFNELHALSVDSPPTPRDLAQLRKLVAASHFSWVSANVREGRKPAKVFAFEQGARRWIIKRVAGVSIGITGLISSEAAPGFAAVPRQLRKRIRVIPPVKAMRKIVGQMRAGGAQIVVVLSHMSHRDTLRVVRTVKGIDVALGTHLGEPTERAAVVKGTIIAVAGPDELQRLGQLDLIVRNGRVVGHTFHRRVVPANGREDAPVRAALAKYLGG
jgi:2',3'-cyclic-nucleotide 2'-phosphodiesterase (5'-nucleotidase family)